MAFKARCFVFPVDNTRRPIWEVEGSRLLFLSVHNHKETQDGAPRLIVPQLSVYGHCKVPFSYADHGFAREFLVVDRLFCSTPSGTEFVAVLGLDFLQNAFARVHLKGDDHSLLGYRLLLAQIPSTEVQTLVIQTHGCCQSRDGAPNHYRDGTTQDGLSITSYGVHSKSLDGLET